MGDDSPDLCECINSREGIMRSLLGLLRQSQTFCDDNSCVDDFSLVPTVQNDAFSGHYITGFIAIIAIIGVLLFGLPRRGNSNEKGSRDFNVCRYIYV